MKTTSSRKLKNFAMRLMVATVISLSACEKAEVTSTFDRNGENGNSTQQPYIIMVRLQDGSTRVMQVPARRFNEINVGDTIRFTDPSIPILNSRPRVVRPAGRESNH